MYVCINNCEIIDKNHKILDTTFVYCNLYLNGNQRSYLHLISHFSV